MRYLRKKENSRSGSCGVSLDAAISLRSPFFGVKHAISVKNRYNRNRCNARVAPIRFSKGESFYV